jgi:hypothetical protein
VGLFIPVATTIQRNKKNPKKQAKKKKNSKKNC